MAYLLDYKGGGRSELHYRRLLYRFLDQNINMKDINAVLTGFFENGTYTAPDTNSFKLRLNAIRANPMQGVRRAIIEKILRLQAKMIFAGQLVMPTCVTSDIAYSE